MVVIAVTAIVATVLAVVFLTVARVPLDVPKIQPDVEDASPEGLKETTRLRRSLQVCRNDGSEPPDCQPVMVLFRQRLYAREGGTAFRYRLGKVDERMIELVRRHRDSEKGRQCVREEPKLWKAPKFPGF